jgi:hypothetical protein
MVTDLSNKIDLLELDISITALKDVLKQMRYYVSNELQKRRVLHIINSLFEHVQ